MAFSMRAGRPDPGSQATIPVRINMPMKARPAVTLVMSPDDPSREVIARQLTRVQVEYRTVHTLRTATYLLRKDDDARIVITGVTLSDGNWCDVLRLTVDRGLRTKLLVCCLEADERLWSEVIWRGGTDVLQEPFDLVHLCWALGLSQHSHDGCVPGGRA